ncbi:MAG: AraC family transcriptional regulator [Rhodobacteraceae bacterium]|nr:AraC family transcriptional regulator [Paracoccaceae bacterium]
MSAESAFHPPTASVQLLTLAQLTHGGDWQLELAHDRDAHLLIWITRGQGVALFDGIRRGIGTHNALFVPARTLMAVHLGRQAYGQAVVVPRDADHLFPAEPWHLRIRDVMAQKELTALFEAMGREQSSARALHDAAMSAQARLMAIWLHRHIEASADPARPDRATLLMQRFSARIVAHYHSKQTLAEHAAALSVTPTHLNRVCRAATGKTASALLSERLVHAARRLLAGTDAPVGHIATHLGFASAAYFTRFMLHHCGLTPTALRRAAENPQRQQGAQPLPRLAR